MSARRKHTQPDETPDVGLWLDEDGKWPPQAVTNALLFDIRRELRTNNAELANLNALLHCQNTVAIPRILRSIDKRLATKLPLKAK